MRYRVQKLLCDYGVCSRRKAEELIKQGRIRINNRVISIGDKASKADKIYLDAKLIKEEKKLSLLFNKPLCCITALRDRKFKTVMDYIKLRSRLFPVGRLDYNTSGLLLLTNDGDFANKVMHPRYEISKTYLVGINKPIAAGEIALIEAGLKLDDGKTSPVKVKKLKSTLLTITLHEGKNRIVRRIFEKLRFTVTSLKRLKIGNLDIGSLKPGKYRFLTKKDKTRIFFNTLYENA